MTIYIPELPLDNSLFPNVNSALSEPDGLLAMGGDLNPQRIINAYNQGIFPWFSEGDPILWWSPSKRAIIKPAFCHISRSMKKVLTNSTFTVTINHAFLEVITNCAQPRHYQAETWISAAMIDAYSKLHQQGFAHSIEVWQGHQLVGGLYGVCIGRLFCGESMFSKVSNSSKIAFIALNQHLSRFSETVIDCQLQSSHLQSLGVQEVSREEFITNLQKCRNKKLNEDCWQRQAFFFKK
ncbi:leucyl/phenylalanyl-tRNA--protein transferase [Psychromonas antarctica]|jgi:leucyl/phenylalanyl-tRNA--protein transferase|uniref:leucyl/phenylalanyl-tRNA--protein transferase n=1 Tax=Psychromonas antarctica TaxID=67573 RepID=UPI001EE9869E|nr:leucyl/phenylalanyl-tRNA--protein transferase [Psychromonas antarctica]MCG6201329.1 leucyl/phenylalanyl-tRNA--protein transferase [Psychromonas antarctica]